MGTPYPIPVTAAQVGSFFVGQYYQLLQQRPDFVHQFYSDSGTMVRVDGENQEAASNVLQIHALIMSLNYTGLEIRTANYLESWNGSVLVMVSGSLHMKDFRGRRKFSETFFLAPEGHNYFILNDVFHFIEEEPINRNQTVLLAQKNLDSKYDNTAEISMPVSNFTPTEDIHVREFIASANPKENGRVDSYSLSEQQLQHFPESGSILDESLTDQSNGLVQNAGINGWKDVPVSIEEPSIEPKRHTYASILCVAKGQSATTASLQNSANQNAPPTSEWSNGTKSTMQQAVLKSGSSENSGTEIIDDVLAIEQDDAIRSVYVRNLLPSTSEAEIEEEFKKFGKIVPDGVVIRSRKDIGICYAFVEFEDMSGVLNAARAGIAYVAGRLLFIEERRINSNIPFRGGRGRGRGRGSYQLDASRGRFGYRGMVRGSNIIGGDREYNRTRANGYYRPVSGRDKGLSQVSNGGQKDS